MPRLDSPRRSWRWCDIFVLLGFITFDLCAPNVRRPAQCRASLRPPRYSRSLKDRESVPKRRSSLREKRRRELPIVGQILDRDLFEAPTVLRRGQLARDAVAVTRRQLSVGADVRSEEH